MSQSDMISQLAAEAAQALRIKDHKKAIELANKILEEDPQHAGAHAVKFTSLFELKRFEQARQMGTVTARLNPNSEFILNNQACLQLEAKQPAAAAGLLRSLIEQFGDRSQWLYNLALAQRMVGNYSYAVDAFRRTLNIEPKHDRAAFQLADCLALLGMNNSAVRAFEYVRLLRSNHAPTQANFIHYASNTGALTELGLKTELALWKNRFIPKDKKFSVIPLKDPNKIQLGFLVGKIPSSWLKSLVAPVVNECAVRGHSVTVYWHDESLPESTFVRSVNVLDSTKFTDADFTREVRANHTEALVDICGMRLGSRQRSLALQVAAKELGWLAHEGVYAAECVELIEDKFDSKQYATNLMQKPAAKPADRTMVAIACSLGVSDEVVKSWVTIMLALEDWQLHLDCGNANIIKTLKEQFEKRGVQRNRLIFDSQPPIGKNTLVLDNYIQNDPVATISAVQQGGIVISKRGDLFPAQHTERILHQVGRDDWIVDLKADYIERAIKLAEHCDATAVDTSEFEEAGLSDISGFTTRLLEALVES